MCRELIIIRCNEFILLIMLMIQPQIFYFVKVSRVYLRVVVVYYCVYSQLEYNKYDEHSCCDKQGVGSSFVIEIYLIYPT